MYSVLCTVSGKSPEGWDRGSEGGKMKGEEREKLRPNKREGKGWRKKRKQVAENQSLNFSFFTLTFFVVGCGERISLTVTGDIDTTRHVFGIQIKK